jgi:hypothetical protein
MAKVVFLGPGEGRQLVLGTNTVTLKAVTDDTEGRFSVMEHRLAAHGPSPPRTCMTSWTTPSMSWRARLCSPWSTDSSPPQPAASPCFPTVSPYLRQPQRHRGPVCRGGPPRRLRAVL